MIDARRRALAVDDMLVICQRLDKEKDVIVLAADDVEQLVLVLQCWRHALPKA